MTEAAPLFEDGGQSDVLGPWRAVCGSPGPYAVRRPSAGNPSRLEVLTCTRPEGHGGLYHQYARSGGAVVAAWERSGKPHYPPTID